MDMDKFINKYRVESTRPPGWDYATAGTIPTPLRFPLAGTFGGDPVQSSQAGRTVKLDEGRFIRGTAALT